MLWLAEDQPSGRWTGVTEGVHMVLDWLEHCLIAGTIPCFFWPAINLLAGLQTDQLEEMVRTVRLMRSQATRLLMACCDGTGYELDTLLEGGTEPLSERELRLRLARHLVCSAVVDGVLYRPTAPCWEYWRKDFVAAAPTGPSQHRLLKWLNHNQSGAYRQQGDLLQALVVAPADLLSGVRLTSPGGDMFTWPAAPILALLTEADLRLLLGDPAAVAAWCHRQLRRPPAERPAGLTAELDTPRGRAELLLQPELLLRAFSEAVPGMRKKWHKMDENTAEMDAGNCRPHETYQQCRQDMERYLSCDLEAIIRRDLPELDGPTAATTAHLWRRCLEHLLSGDRLWVKYTGATSRWPDRWQLCQYLDVDSQTEGKTRRCTGPGRLQTQKFSARLRRMN